MGFVQLTVFTTHDADPACPWPGRSLVFNTSRKAAWASFVAARVTALGQRQPPTTARWPVETRRPAPAVRNRAKISPPPMVAVSATCGELGRVGFHGNASGKPISGFGCD